MIKKPLGIGIIGAGHIMKSHALAYLASPEMARLVAVADTNAKRARSAKDLYRFDLACDDYQELLARDDIHAVSVCTPAEAHTPVVLDALRAGKHVLCEKPMATNLADADRIIQAADQTDRTISFVFQLRSEATHKRMRGMIAQGHIGRPLSAKLCVHLRKKPAYYKAAPGRGSWKTDGGGVLVNQAIHQLDALISFLGEPVAVGAVMDTFVQPIEAEDTIVGWVRFKSGAVASIDCTACAQKKEFSITVIGASAGMRIAGDPDAGKFDLRIDSTSSAARRELRAAGLRIAPPPPADPPKLLKSIKKLVSKATRRPLTPPAHRGHTPQVREFLQAAITGDPPPVPPREARRSLQLAIALYEAASTRSVVSLPLDTTNRCYAGVTMEKQTAPVAEPSLESVAAKE